MPAAAFSSDRPSHDVRNLFVVPRSGVLQGRAVQWFSQHERFYGPDCRYDDPRWNAGGVDTFAALNGTWTG